MPWPPPPLGGLPGSPLRKRRSTITVQWPKGKQAFIPVLWKRGELPWEKSFPGPTGSQGRPEGGARVRFGGAPQGASFRAPRPLSPLGGVHRGLLATDCNLTDRQKPLPGPTRRVLGEVLFFSWGGPVHNVPCLSNRQACPRGLPVCLGTLLGASREE